MPEPDFDQIARDLLVETGRPWPTVRDAIAAQLRQVWNARGAADRAIIEQGLLSMMNGPPAFPYVTVLHREVRKLDR